MLFRSHDRIVLIGFDLGPGANDSYNNVYADTEFYRRSSARPVTAVNWIDQLQTIARKFAQVQFQRVLGTTSTYVSKFDTIDNFRQITIQDFQYP